MLIISSLDGLIPEGIEIIVFICGIPPIIMYFMEENTRSGNLDKVNHNQMDISLKWSKLKLQKRIYSNERFNYHVPESPLFRLLVQTHEGLQAIKPSVNQATLIL